MGDSDAIEADRNKTTKLSEYRIHTYRDSARYVSRFLYVQRLFGIQEERQLSLGLKAGCSTIHATSRDVHKTLTKSRATHRMTSNDLTHTTHDSKLRAPSRNTSQNLPLKPQESNLRARASKPIVDPQGSNLCDPETQKPYKTPSASQRV